MLEGACGNVEHVAHTDELHGPSIDVLGSLGLTLWSQ